MIGEALNKETGDFLAADGVIYPVVAWFDDEGGECEWFEAVSAVAGGGSTWFALDLREFVAKPS